MSNDNSNALVLGIDVPTLGQRIAKAGAQKVLTILFTLLLAHGLVMADQQMSFVEIGSGIVLAAASALWTYLHEKNGNDRLVSALKSPAATVVTP